jgi:hypothetical protein
MSSLRWQATFLAAQACVGTGIRVHAGGVGHDVDARQAVPLTGLEVGVVMGGRDLHRARPEVALDEVIGHDRHVSLHEGDAHHAADQLAVAVVIGVHGHGGVAQDGLRSRGRHGDGLVRAGLAARRCPLRQQVVADGPQLPLLGRADDLEVRDAGAAAWAPVDELLAAVGKAILVQPLEGDAHRPGGAVVHGETLAAPVGRAAEAPLLGHDHRARLVHEAPHALEILVATELLGGGALIGEHSSQHPLGGDGGMVHARQPQGRPMLHARSTDHQVLGRGTGRVAEMQRTGDVRRRHDDHERLGRGAGAGACAIGCEDVGIEPALIDGRLDLGRLVRLGHRCRRSPGGATLVGPLCRRLAHARASPPGDTADLARDEADEVPMPAAIESHGCDDRDGRV